MDRSNRTDRLFIYESDDDLRDSSTLREETPTGLTIYKLLSQPNLRQVVFDGQDGGGKAASIPARPQKAAILRGRRQARQRSIHYSPEVLDVFSGDDESDVDCEKEVVNSQNTPALAKRPIHVYREDGEKSAHFSAAGSNGQVYLLDHESGHTTWVSVTPRQSTAELQPLRPVQSPPSKAGGPATIDVQSWRRVLLVGSVLMGLFLGFLDTTIVAVALPTIANDFQDFSHSTWIITAYLLSYMAFAIIISRLSDIFGRQIIEISSFVIFLTFSLGCALSPNMITLLAALADCAPRFPGQGHVSGEDHCQGQGRWICGLRFQIVDGSTPVVSGLRLLPLLFTSSVGSIVTGALNSKRNNTAFTVIGGAALQLLGLALMISLGDSTPTPSSAYGFQVPLGLGVGFIMSSVTMVVQFQSAPQWTAVTQGSLTQMRTLGGSIGLAAATIVFNQAVRGSSALHGVLTPSQLDAIYKSPLVLESLSDRQQRSVSKIYADGFTQEMKIATYIAAASCLISLLTIQRHPPFKKGGPPGANKDGSTEEQGLDLQQMAASKQFAESFWTMQNLAY